MGKEKNMGIFKKFVAKLTNIGGSLQTPIAILPAAGILLALGTIFTSPAFLNQLPFELSATVIRIFEVALQCGSIIFGNLPLIFAVGVAIGLTNNDGVAGLSAIVGYLIMNVTIGGTLGITPELLAESRSYASILGIPTLQTGVVGGIIVGVLASSIYNKFHNVKLPIALEFFAGKRSVPIITAFASFALGLVMTIVWPPIGDAINALSASIAGMNSALAGFMFGFVERLTIPFGMNHVWWPTFWLQAGEYVNKAGNVVNGDQLIFFAQMADQVPITAGTFMNGLFVLKMFSMPAAAYAMYKTAKPENKQRVAGILISGALTSFVAGITEPLEFAFIFAAPALFLVHAVVTGLGFAVMNILGANLGLSFSGGFLDYIFFNVIPNRTNWWIAIPVGIVLFVIYYALFRFTIEKFDLKVLGREDAPVPGEEDVVAVVDDEDRVAKVVEALGGKDNIVNVNACYSRLRVDVKDLEKVKKNQFTYLGASGVNNVGNNVQVIYGTKAVGMKENVLAYLQGKETKTVVDDNSVVSENETELQNIFAPFEGVLMSLDLVPDKVFSERMMGDGFAIDMEGTEVRSPINGTVFSVFPTQHAISLIDQHNNEVLLHIGLETVHLNGEGFQTKVTQGQKVNVGDLLVEIDSEQIKNKGISLISPIVFTNLNKEKYKVVLNKEGKVNVSETDLIRVAERINK